MSAAPILVDFASRPRRGGLTGAALLGLGPLCAAFVGFNFGSVSAQRSALELRLDARESMQHKLNGESSGKYAEDAGPIMSELAMPWSQLLKELEAASRDSGEAVAVLSIEPDRQRNRVRITAEARNLAT